MGDGWDDERLLAALSEALKARQAVPSWFAETGKNAFAGHNIDAELAQLTYDPNIDQREMAVMRSERASIRALTFTFVPPHGDREKPWEVRQRRPFAELMVSGCGGGWLDRLRR